jgi:hypothetical protein
MTRSPPERGNPSRYPGADRACLTIAHRLRFGDDERPTTGQAPIEKSPPGLEVDKRPWCAGDPEIGSVIAVSLDARLEVYCPSVGGVGSTGGGSMGTAVGAGTSTDTAFFATRWCLANPPMTSSGRGIVGEDKERRRRTGSANSRRSDTGIGDEDRPDPAL